MSVNLTYLCICFYDLCSCMLLYDLHTNYVIEHIILYIAYNCKGIF